MTINFKDALGVHADALQLRAERTRVLASNIANESTPGYPSADGNTVEIGVEQAAFSQNASDFQTSLTFITMKLRGLAKAIEG